MHIERYHGLGNDYLVWVDGPAITAEQAIAICDRHTGVGGDGVLEPFETAEADFGCRIWNPDGSVAEKSGNGLRIFAQWLVDSGRSGPTFSVMTTACLVRCEVGPDDVTVDMGAASFQPADIGLLTDAPLLDGALKGRDTTWPVVAVSMGNPHCVQFHEGDLDRLPWRAWGEEIEVHPLFANRTNVQFARIIDDHTVEIRIWERGAGETLASGSSSCAAAAAAVKTGRCRAGRIRVLMPGGELTVEVGEDWEVRLIGPVERVGRFEVDDRWWGRRS